MQIVPRADELVVEAKVAPFDIDQIATGAHLRPCASCPATSVRVTRVSADIEREQQQNSAQPAQAYYTVRVSLPADEVARLTDIHPRPCGWLRRRE